MSRHARFEILMVSREKILIRDVGPWSQYPTITNDAENVVAEMIADIKYNGFFIQLGNRRSFYEDSEGKIDELVVRDGKFDGFKSGGWWI